MRNNRKNRNNWRYLLFCIPLLGFFLSSCEREPMLNLHQDGKDIIMETLSIGSFPYTSFL